MTFERTLLQSGPLIGGIALLSCYNRLALHWSARIIGSPADEHQNLATNCSSMASLINHSSLLALNILSLELPPSQILLHAILVYLSISSKCASRLQLSPPSPLIIYFLLFISPHPQVLSAICAILTTHRYNLENSSIDIALSVLHHDRDQINALNGILMDTANLLWRSRAFNATDSNAQACLLHRQVFVALQTYTSSIPVPPQNLATVFGLSSHPLLSGFAIAAFRQLEDAAIIGGMDVRVRHAGPITQRSLGALEMAGGVNSVDWKGYRIGVLDWLSERGLSGVQELMGSTMKGMGLGRDRAQQVENGRR